MSLPVAVLAGGLATRLGSVSAGVPKVLLDVDGCPFAWHLAELLARQGVRDVVWCVGHLGDQVQRTLGDGARWSMRFTFVFDGPTLAGTGGALLRALPHLGPAFFVMYGDSYLTCAFPPVETAFRASGKMGLMTVFRNDDQWDRSNIRLEDGRIVTYDKARRDPAMRHIDYGLGVLTAMAFEPWQQRAEPFDLALVYQDLLARNELAAFEVDRRFYEIGSVEGLAETRAVLEGRSEAR